MFKKNIKSVVIPIIIINIMVLISAWYTFYGRRALLDTSVTPKVQSELVSKIEIKAGNWKWTDKQWPDGRETKLTITDREDIDLFCSVLSASKAKYIDNIRASDGWLEIFFTEDGRESLKLVLKVNYQKEIFIEYDGKTFEGEGIADIIKVIAIQYGK